MDFTFAQGAARLGDRKEEELDHCYYCGFSPLAFYTPEEKQKRCLAVKRNVTYAYDESLREKYTYHSEFFDKELSDKYHEGGWIKFMKEDERKSVFRYNSDGSLAVEHSGEEPCTVYIPTYIARCPTCGSTEIVRISSLERIGSIALLGIFSPKISKTFRCNNCGYTW